MTQIKVNVRDKHNAELLLELLSSLDFVDHVESNLDIEETEVETSELDFFDAMGIWTDRDITLESIRKQAWPQQQK